jgi:hypothetical protein
MITYLIGDATSPIGEGEKLICHISNDLGGWGAGFVLALSKKWKMPEFVFLSSKKLVLGEVQFVIVENDITVCNMIAQHGIGIDKTTKIPPIRYDALRECLKKVNKGAVEINATIHAPRFGAGLSGGDWSIIEQIIKEEISVEVYIYDLK